MSLRDLFVKSNDTPTPERVLGKITKVTLPDPNKNEKGGWGFIASDSLPFTRVFFYWQALLPGTLRFDQLQVGMKVEFTPVDMPNQGMRALKIKVVE